MAERETGGSAFPRLEPVERFDEDAGKYRESLEPVDGMDLRDYFAAQAMAGLIRNRDALHVLNCEPEFPWTENVADSCYKLADAMIKARKAGR